MHADGPAAVLRSVEERTAVVIRLLVVCSVGLVLVVEPGIARGRAEPLGALVVATFGYALVLALAEWRGRRLVPPRLATSIDALLALLACGLTGGADSVMVAILPLVVIAGAVRGGVVVGRLGALAVGAGFTVAALAGSDPHVPAADRWLAGAWWTGYLIAAAVLVGVLLRMLERQYEDAAESRARARAEHEAFMEERDLRSRLLAAQQARLDGVRVVLHEFRTPVASLTALSTDLAADRLSGRRPRGGHPAARRARPAPARHARRPRRRRRAGGQPAGPGSASGRSQLAELAAAVLDAAGVAPERSGAARGAAGRRRALRPAAAAARADQPRRERRPAQR